MSEIIILHGYSDDRDSFEPLASFLGQNGFTTTQIFLGDYVSLEDTVTIPDLAKAFEAALGALGIATTKNNFDLIVHSTGSLVAREWLTRFYLEEGKPCPIWRYLMLAPANFGSPLGHIGKTMLGRVVKGWRTGFESGTKVLDSLELASPYTWQLARRDLFGEKSFYQPGVCLTAVLVGSKPYQTGLRQIVDKNGGDGTVYVCTANLNATGIALNLGRKGDKPVAQVWERAAEPIALGVFPDRDHGSITRPDQGDPQLGQFILDFLHLDSTPDYRAYSQRCDALTATTLPTATPPAADIFHTYQNLVARVTDDLGFSVADYFLEFYERPGSARDEKRVDDLMVTIHTEILESVHVYGNDSSYRSLLFDLTDLAKILANDEELVFSLSAAHLSDLIGYSAGADNDIGEYPVDDLARSPFWQANSTVLLDVCIERTQSADTFKLAPA